MDVGVRELKRGLSEYLDRAARGERIVITDRGRPKALLAPLPGGDRVALGIEEGWITAPRATAPRPTAPPRVAASGTVQQALDEDRDER